MKNRTSRICLHWESEEWSHWESEERRRHSPLLHWESKEWNAFPFSIIGEVKNGASIAHSFFEKVQGETRLVHSFIEKVKSGSHRLFLHWECEEWHPLVQSYNEKVKGEELPSSTPVLLCQWWSGRWGLRPYFLKEGLDDGHSVLNSSIPCQRKWRMELHSFIEKMKSGTPPRFYHGGSEERSLNRSLLRWESKPVSSTPSLRK